LKARGDAVAPDGLGEELGGEVLALLGGEHPPDELGGAGGRHRLVRCDVHAGLTRLALALCGGAVVRTIVGNFWTWYRLFEG